MTLLLAVRRDGTSRRYSTTTPSGERSSSSPFTTALPSSWIQLPWNPWKSRTNLIFSSTLFCLVSIGILDIHITRYVWTVDCIRSPKTWPRKNELVVIYQVPCWYSDSIYFYAHCAFVYIVMSYLTGWCPCLLFHTNECNILRELRDSSKLSLLCVGLGIHQNFIRVCPWCRTMNAVGLKLPW